MTVTEPGARRAQQVEQRLRQALAPSHLAVHDESHLHAGHAGAADGRSHFAVDIVSARFENLTRLARHRLVNEALAELLVHDIHALRIKARTPAEAGQNTSLFT